MGINNLSDKELQTIISKKGGLGEFLKDKENLARFMGVDSRGKRRISDLLKHDKGMSAQDIKKRIDEMAFIHSTVTDFF